MSVSGSDLPLYVFAMRLESVELVLVRFIGALVILFVGTAKVLVLLPLE